MDKKRRTMNKEKQTLDKAVPNSWQDIEKEITKHRQTMDKTWTNNRQNTDRIWPKHGQAVHGHKKCKQLTK